MHVWSAGHWILFQSGDNTVVFMLQRCTGKQAGRHFLLVRTGCVPVATVLLLLLVVVVLVVVVMQHAF